MKQGDLVLVPFPFSDQSGRKVRPVIIVSNDNYNSDKRDLIVVGVTSNIHVGEVKLNSHNLKEGTLHDLCSVKVDNILKISKKLVIKKIGRVNKEKLKEIITLIQEIVELT